ncbi:MAG: hypothetical protein ACR2QB_11075 [Gammaproteobacteria bacterium]
MNWFNGFSGVLELSCSRLGWRYSVRQARVGSSGWQLQLWSGAWIRAELRQAWLAGQLAGLAWQAQDGSRHYALIRASRQASHSWRRLRVILRLPRA